MTAPRPASPLRHRSRSCRPKERVAALRNFPEGPGRTQAPRSSLPNAFGGWESLADTFPQTHERAPTSYYRPEFNVFNIRNTNDAYLRHPVKSL